MRFYPIKVYGEVTTGEVDRLGNAITTEKLLDEDSQGRKAIWTDEQVAADPRILEHHLQKVVTTCKRVTLENASCVEVAGEKYRVEWIKGEDDTRWRIVALIAWTKG